ncbi:MAG TPA: hypothetical protein VF791_06215 [Pyrinomonadaceae bacterium]
MIVLDEQLNDAQIARDIARWYKGAVINILQLRPHTRIFDDAVPTILRTIKQPTFVTINYTDFWKIVPASDDYCIICFKLSATGMYLIPELLRRVLSLEEFRTKRLRMGAVVSVRGESLQMYRAS